MYGFSPECHTTTQSYTIYPIFTKKTRVEDSDLPKGILDCFTATLIECTAILLVNVAKVSTDG